MNISNLFKYFVIQYKPTEDLKTQVSTTKQASLLHYKKQ